jgi:xanthine dehydrogenase accessory factor
MTRSIKVWQLIHDSLQKKLAVMLLYVLESSGSSPGRQGFFMAVNANNEIEGSIGGGIMEHKFVEMAKEWLRATSHELRAGEVRKQIHDKSAAKDRSGMICSGEQTILLYPVTMTDIDSITAVLDSMQRNENGTLRLSPAGISFSSAIPATDFQFEMRSESDWKYVEKTGYKNRLYIIGGGHCSYALSRLLSGMDFYITVYDDRSGLNTMIKNDFAHQKIILARYEQLNELIPPGKNHYVVIMTMGYRTDDLTLRALLGKEFRYLGLLGSKTKIQKMMDTYGAEGLNTDYLQRIHAPIGLDIKSETPEEIAVSIMAEIIAVKNRPV